MSPSPSIQLSTASHLPFILPSHSYPTYTNKGHGADLTTELAFFSYSHMLTILPSFLPSRTVTCTCTCGGQTTPMCQARYTPRTPPLASSWVQVGGYSGFYSLREAPVSWMRTESREPRATLCPLEVVSSPLRRCNSPGNPKGECDIGGAGVGRLDRWVHGCR